MRHDVELLSVLIVNETITEHSVSFSHEERDKVILARDVLVLAHKHTLNDLRQITQVEGVAALSGSGQEVMDSLLVNVHSRLNNKVCVRSKTTLGVKLEVTL